MSCAVCRAPAEAIADNLRAALAAPDSALARAALVIARIEYPRLDPEPCLARLDEPGREEWQHHPRIPARHPRTVPA